MFYPKDWLSEPKINSLSYEHQGMYMQLLCMMWVGSKDQCSCESAPKRIAKLLGIPKAKAAKLIAELQNRHEPMFEEVDDRYVSSRLQKERDRLLARQESGNKSARVRTEKSTVIAVDKADALSPEIHECVELLFESVKENTPRKLVYADDSVKLAKWKADSALAIDKMHRIDNVSISDIKAAIAWIRNDKPDGRWTGWGSVILSGKKLRIKYPKLVIRMESDGEKVHAKTTWADSDFG